jgi:hypothetical protein
MNKKELTRTYFAFLKEYDLKNLDVLVGAGGAMLMIGLRDSTNDIDVSSPVEVYNKFKKIKAFQI